MSKKTAMKKLKPCPFCGSTPLAVVNDETEVVDNETEVIKFGVKCFNCGGAIRAEKDTLDEAISAWNKRARGI